MIGKTYKPKVELTHQRETEPIVLSSKAIATVKHRDHIREHFVELMDIITKLEQTTYGILCHAMTTAEAEAAAETIDEEIHRVQYKLDHCRRLLQVGIHL